jgi:SAM-dependent methyltransferase
MHFHAQGLENAPGVVRAMVRELPTKERWLDVGAGTGVFAAELIRQGRHSIACERSPKGRRVAAKQGVDCRHFDLTLSRPAQLEGTFDVAYCFEVAEHLPPELGDKLVEFLVAMAPTVIFTAAHPGQGGTGHINEQPQSYWIERVVARGMTYDTVLTPLILAGFKAENVRAEWFHENLMVFARSSDDGALRNFASAGH